MKNSILILACLTLTSCGVSTSAIKETIANDCDCPKEQVKIVEKARSFDSATYKVDACGKNYIYKVFSGV